MAGPGPDRERILMRMRAASLLSALGASVSIPTDGAPIGARIWRRSAAYLSVLVSFVASAPLAAQDGVQPDRNPAHFAAMLIAADSAYLRLWAKFGDVDAIHRRLRVDPRPITIGTGWPTPSDDELVEGPVTDVRRQALRELGIEESTDGDLRCVRFRWAEEHKAESRARQRRCLALERLWVFASPTTRSREVSDGTAVWSTRFYATRAGLAAVMVEVTSRRRGEHWDVVEVRMTQGVQQPMFLPAGGRAAVSIRTASASP
jgi:hypothetical protein